MNVIKLTIVTFALVAGSSYVRADETADYQAIKDMLVRESGSHIDIMAVAGNYLRPLTHGRGYFEPSDVEIFAQVSNARQRAQIMAQNLSYDLDGNMEVTKDEVTKSVEINSGGSSSLESIQRAVDQVMLADKNGDGKLSGDEIAQPRSRSVAPDYSNNSAKFGTAMLALDPNKDGRLTQAEILGILSHVAEIAQ